MSSRAIASRGLVTVVLAAATVTAGCRAGQDASPAPDATAGKTFVVPRTADGRPDLNGVWDFRTITPVERPDDLAGKAVLSGEEATEFEKRTLEGRNPDRRDGGKDADVGRAYNQFWWDYGSKMNRDGRTSLIIDPPDGKIPPLTPEAQKREAAQAALRRMPPRGPEDRSLGERCILGFNTGPPMLPSAYNNNLQIFQTRNHVALYNEMVHDARVVPLDGRPPGTIPQWTGSSRGRWDGDTLVVETTNFLRDTSFRSSSATLHLIERFSRVASDTLLYQFTVEDPTTWTKPWTVALPMLKSEDKIYEYACHEGNYGMTNMLAGARAEESGR